MVARVEAVLAELGIKVEPSARGGWLWGLCPFHKDTEPSWHIRTDPTHERYGQSHCFACGGGGTLADVVSHVRGITLSGARDWLSEFKETVQVVKRAPPTTARVEHIDPVTKRFKMPPEVIFEPFRKWVSPARAYAEKRGLTERQIKIFSIGYAVEGRLAGRIVFATLDPETCQPASYMARDFSGARRAKRYLFPYEEEHANRDIMFGEHLWRMPGYRDTVIVTEGALNALAVERAAIMSYVQVDIAAIGTSNPGDRTFAAHMGKLATFKHVVILTDSDPAGDKVAAQISAQLAGHTRVSRVRLPGELDANDVAPETLRSILWPTHPKDLPRAT